MAIHAPLDVFGHELFGGYGKQAGRWIGASAVVDHGILLFLDGNCYFVKLFFHLEAKKSKTN
jgi:hypothetical protein